jgi:hypothetical protein
MQFLQYIEVFISVTFCGYSVISAVHRFFFGVEFLVLANSLSEYSLF